MLAPPETEKLNDDQAFIYIRNSMPAYVWCSRPYERDDKDGVPSYVCVAGYMLGEKLHGKGFLMKKGGGHLKSALSDQVESLLNEISHVLRQAAAPGGSGK